MSAAWSHYVPERACRLPDHYAGSREPNYQPTKFQLVITLGDG